jgi:hypothetical protein
VSDAAATASVTTATMLRMGVGKRRVRFNTCRPTPLSLDAGRVS